jgi:chlorobactene glucosyltransferase
MPFSTTDLLWALPWILAPLIGPIFMRRRPRLSDNPPPPDSEAPLVSVIVPARNEAENLPGIVATLLTSRYPRYEIIIVDDGSTDGTTDIADRLAANHADCIRVIHGAALPDGWVGKCWACWQGYRNAKGDVLVFTDADTRHHPRLLGHSVGALRANRVSLVTTMPRQLTFTFWERIIQPQMFAAILWRYRDPAHVNRTRNPRDVIANGQYIVFDRDAYEAIGGHEAVKGEVVEDLGLAQRTVASGRTLYLGHGQDLIATRMYRSLPGIVEGWSKNLARASRHTVDPWLRPAVPWLVAAFFIIFWVVPAIALVTSPFTATVSFGWALAAVLASLVFWIWIRRRLSVPVVTALLYPLGAIMVAFLFMRSALMGDTVKWRGRTYGGLSG